MMKIRIIITTCILGLLVLLPSLPAEAQKRKPVRKTPPKEQPVVVEETPAERLFKTMLPSTAKVMFIDSIVVDKESFLNHIPLSPEAGTITSYENFFERQAQVPLAVFKNEFGDRCYYADGDTLGTALFSIDRLGNSWSKPRELSEFGDEYLTPNYPFLQSDGITLFFAAKGNHSIGGYDIFMTLYNAEDGQFYRPENYGLPFNSTANDYLIAFDDVNELGFLVSDRYQPADKVCIYTFVPQFPRVSFEDEDLSDNRLRQYASLANISDTWRFGDREAALQRYQATQSRSVRQNHTGIFSFVINDQTIYHQLSDFRSAQARDLYQKYAALEKSSNTDERTLELQSDKYSNASAHNQRLMREAMLRLEHQLDEKRVQLKDMAKEIRRMENQ